MKASLCLIGIVTLVSVAVWHTNAQSDQNHPDLKKIPVRTFGLSEEQRAQKRAALDSLKEMDELIIKLSAAKRVAVETALDKNATEATIRPKVEAVAAIQTEIALLTYTKGVKATLASINDEQTAGLKNHPDQGYTELFVPLTTPHAVGRGVFVPKGPLVPTSQSAR